jgi:hypothetical protein
MGILSEEAAIGKAFANLQAECALAGVALVQSTDDRGQRVFVVSRWAMARELPSLAAVSTWLRMVTGASAAIEADGRDLQ